MCSGQLLPRVISLGYHIQNKPGLDHPLVRSVCVGWSLYPAFQSIASSTSLDHQHAQSGQSIQNGQSFDFCIFPVPCYRPEKGHAGNAESQNYNLEACFAGSLVRLVVL